MTGLNALPFQLVDSEDEEAMEFCNLGQEEDVDQQNKKLKAIVKRLAIQHPNVIERFIYMIDEMIRKRIIT